MLKVKKIKPLDGFSNVSDGDVVSRGTSVQTHMTGNSDYPNPPVDLAALKTAIDVLAALIAEALDGSKKITAEKNKQREVVIKMLRLLGRYVEVACQDDMAIFKSSGFEPASTAKVVTPSLSEKIRKIEHGANSGQIVVWIKADSRAYIYEIRYGLSVNGGSPNARTTDTVIRVKGPVTLNALTPGATYLFQARALVKDGYTDWSNSVAFMCT